MVPIFELLSTDYLLPFGILDWIYSPHSLAKSFEPLTASNLIFDLWFVMQDMVSELTNDFPSFPYDVTYRTENLFTFCIYLSPLKAKN